MSTAQQTATEVQIRKPDRLIVRDEGPAAYLFDTARFEHLFRIATAIARMSLLPDHLRVDRGKHELPIEAVTANCFRIVNQAIRWGLDPFAMVDETYVVANKLGYQGKLIIAVVNARAGLEGRLSFTYEGSGDQRTVTVSGRFKDETTHRTITLSVAQAKTTNDMWKKDPDQKLAYTGATKWARRHCPEIMLGVLTDDDLERMQSSQALGANEMARLAASGEPKSDIHSLSEAIKSGGKPAAPPPAEEPPFNPPTPEEIAEHAEPPQAEPGPVVEPEAEEKQRESDALAFELMQALENCKTDGQRDQVLEQAHDALHSGRISQRQYDALVPGKTPPKRKQREAFASHPNAT